MGIIFVHFSMLDTFLDHLRHLSYKVHSIDIFEIKTESFLFYFDHVMILRLFSKPNDSTQKL